MRVTIRKKASRAQLTCVRRDGTSVTADLGPALPFHDLAHLVVERAFALQDGFFGNIARGYTPQQLSDKAVILRLGRAPYRAEVLARALGSLQTGACAAAQFEALVNAELIHLGLDEMHIPPPVVERLMEDFRLLVANYSDLRVGDSMEVDVDDQVILYAAT